MIITAPASGKVDFTTVVGINDCDYEPESHDVISNASCTTNCFGMLVKVLHENFSIRRGEMTTIHSYTNDQRILDTPHKDKRRARAAALSIIPYKHGSGKRHTDRFSRTKRKTLRGSRKGAHAQRVACGF